MITGFVAITAAFSTIGIGAGFVGGTVVAKKCKTQAQDAAITKTQDAAITASLIEIELEMKRKNV